MTRRFLLLLPLLLALPAGSAPVPQGEVHPSFPVHYSGGSASSENTLDVGSVSLVRDGRTLYVAAYYRQGNGVFTPLIGKGALADRFRVTVRGVNSPLRGRLEGTFEGEEWSGTLSLGGQGTAAVAGRIRVTDATATRLLPGTYDAERRDESGQRVIVTISLNRKAKYTYSVRRGGAVVYQLIGKWTPVVLGLPEGDRLFFAVLPTGGSPSVIPGLPQLTQIGDYSADQFSIQFLGHDGQLEWVAFNRRQ